MEEGSNTNYGIMATLWNANSVIRNENLLLEIDYASPRSNLGNGDAQDLSIVEASGVGDSTLTWQGTAPSFHETHYPI